MPAKILTKIEDSLNQITIPLGIRPNGVMCDGATSYVYYCGEPEFYFSWYVTPESWEPLEEWFCQTDRILSEYQH